jgi:outer membrane cobalamin receptor
LYVPDSFGTLLPEADTTWNISRSDLNWEDYRYLGHLLHKAPALVHRDPNSPGQYDGFSYYGAGERGTAILAQGRPLTDPVSGSSNVYLISPEPTERIEIITGTRSFVFGAAGAAVNLVFNNPDNVVPVTKIRYAEGADTYSLLDGSYAQNILRGTNLSLGFQHQTIESRYVNSAHDAWNLRARLRHSFSSRFHVVLSEYYTSSQTDLNGGLDLRRTSPEDAPVPQSAVVVNPDAYEKIRRHDADLTFAGTFFADTTDITTLTLYLSEHLREYRDEENRETPNGIFLQEDTRTSWWGAALSQRFTGGVFAAHAGGTVEFRRVRESPAIGQREDVVGSAWGIAEASIIAPLTIGVCARFDHWISQEYGSVGADVSIKPWEEIRLFGGVSSSYRMPTYAELFWVDSTVTRATTIDAEHHRLLEGGVEWVPGSHGRVRLAYFHRIIDNPLLAQLQAGPAFPGVHFANGATTRIQGLDVRAGIQIGFLWFDGSALVIPRLSGADVLQRAYPQVTARGGVFFRQTLLDGKLGLKIGFRGTYVSAYEGPAFNPQVVTFVSTSSSVGNRATGDFFAIAHIGDAYVHFMWENFADVFSYGTPYYPIYGQQIRFGISWEFLN